MRDSEKFYFPGRRQDPTLAERKERFSTLNAFVTERGGWVTSVPGDNTVTVECLPDSTLPRDLAAEGYDLVATGSGERILPTAIVQRFTLDADGEMELLTAGSTRPVTSTVTHAGIAKVERYSFEMT